jgi:hypothetical protein
MTVVDVARERVRGCSLPGPFFVVAHGFAGTAEGRPAGPDGELDGLGRFARMTFAVEKNLIKTVELQNVSRFMFTKNR